MEHDYLIQQEAKMHMRNAEEEARQSRLARSARASRHWEGWVVLAAALTRAAVATERAAEAIRSRVLGPSGAGGAAPGGGVNRETNPSSAA